jgi:hypothetical protein
LDTYTRDFYGQELERLEREHTIRLWTVPWRILDVQIVFPGDDKPIHPNHLLIYETALAL